MVIFHSYVSLLEGKGDVDPKFQFEKNLRRGPNCWPRAGDFDRASVRFAAQQWPRVCQENLQPGLETFIME